LNQQSALKLVQIVERSSLRSLLPITVLVSERVALAPADGRPFLQVSLAELRNEQPPWPPDARVPPVAASCPWTGDFLLCEAPQSSRHGLHASWPLRARGACVQRSGVGARGLLRHQVGLFDTGNREPLRLSRFPRQRADLGHAGHCRVGRGNPANTTFSGCHS